MASLGSFFKRGASATVRVLTTRSSRPLPRIAPSAFGVGGTQSLTTFAWYACVGLTLVGMTFATFRHFAYLVPFICLIYGLAMRSGQLPPPTYPFLLLICMVIAMAPWVTSDGWKDAFFMLSGISVALVFRPQDIRFRPGVVLLLFGLSSLYFTVVRGGVPTSIIFDPLNSKSTFESSVSFGFGMLAVYFAMNRQRWWALLAFVLCLVAMKRVAVLGAAVCILLNLLPERWQRRLCNPVTAIIVNFIFIAFAISYATNALDTWIHDVFGISANALGQGRQTLYSHAAYEILEAPYRFLFIGDGAGQSYMLNADELFPDERKSQIHSNILQIFYEYGGIALLLFTWLGYRQENIRARLLFMYANVLFLTDNVLVYHFVVFFLVSLSVRLEVDKPAPARKWFLFKRPPRPRPWANTAPVVAPAGARGGRLFR